MVWAGLLKEEATNPRSTGWPCVRKVRKVVCRNEEINYNQRKSRGVYCLGS